MSVLSAVEGVELLDPSLERAAVPITLVVLALLFAVQRRGTAHVARVFGPVMVLWFLAIGASGAAAVLHEPAVLAAFAPQNGLELLRSHPGVALTIIGAVFLALTGGEALYADMGHFGSRPVRTAWFVLVWPALVLNYLDRVHCSSARAVRSCIRSMRSCPRSFCHSCSCSPRQRRSSPRRQ